MILMIHFVK